MAFRLNRRPQPQQAGYVPTDQLFPAWERALRLLYWLTPVLVIGGAWLVYRNRAREFVPPSFPEPRQISPAGAYAAAPAISSDGRSIAYASTAIWIIENGGAPRRLTPGALPETDPEFSPDGSLVAYRSEEDGGGIYTIPAAGGTPRRIAANGWRPRFSPDGRSIAYFRTDGEGSTYGYGRIYVVSPNGAVPKQIAPNFQFARHTVWIDDDTILFEGTDDRGASDWWVTSVHSSNPPVRTGAFLKISESIQGKRGSPERYHRGRILFSAVASGPAHLYDIEFRRSDWQASSEPRQLTAGPLDESRPTVSGDRILFTRRQLTAEVHALRFDTNEPAAASSLVQLTHNSGLATLPMTSLPGDRFLYVSNRTGTPDVWVQSEGREPQRLTVMRRIGFHPVLSPDGRRVSLALADQEGCAIDTRDIDSDAETIVEGCFQIWDASGDRLLVYRPEQAIKTIDLLKGPGAAEPILRHPSHGVYSARLSPDGKWIAFASGYTSGDAPVYIAPFTGSEIPQNKWIPIHGLTGIAAWSPDGNTLYARSGHQSYQCIYAQRLDRSKRPAGELIPIHHFHKNETSIGLLSPQEFYLTAAKDKLVFNIGQEASTVWSTTFPE